ncbi:MAG TPA: sugar porter family MFS transporter, partial [Vicinamibacteria bacterium]|nr:sugar porter family MFS transporter [Vicinamibacteria bacterium]
MAEPAHRSRATVTLISAVAATGGLLFGFDTGVISGALPFLRDHWRLASGQIEWLTTAVLVGAVLGSLLSGRVTDVLGRKKVMFATAVVFLAGAIWTGLAGSSVSLGLGRVVVGFAIGIASFATPLYIAEIAPTRNRGALVSLNQLMITIGILVSYAADYAFADNANLESWRYMFLAGAVPAIVLLVGMLFLPETPRWLIAQGREAEGRAILERVEDPDLVEEAVRRVKEDAAAESRYGNAWTEILQPWLRPPLLIAVFIFFFQQFSGINTIIYYSPIIFQKAGFTSNAAAILPSVIVGTVNVLFTFVSIALLDRLGRRPLYLVGFSGLIVALVSLGLSFEFQARLGEATKWATVGSMLLFCAFFAMSLGPLGWLIISEVFPLRIRGIGASIGSLSHWLWNALIAFNFLTIMNALGPARTFWLFAAVGVVG